MGRLNSLSNLEKELRKYERVKELDDRYIPSPVKEKMRFPEAAFKGTKVMTKGEKRVAALQSETTSCSSERESTGKEVEENKMEKTKAKKKDEANWKVE